MFLLAIVSPAVAHEPFATYNQSPLVQIYGLPSLGSARLLPPGTKQLDITLEAANHFFNATGPNESLTLDGETHRAAVTVRGGAHGFEWGVEVPYVSHSGGFMDSFIEGWHDTFGMPNGGRELTSRKQLNFLYRRDGTDRVRLNDRAGGLGDVRLYGAWPLSPSGASTDTALRASIKLPTGESRDLHGSGGTDGALWLATACSPSACPGFSLSAAGGVLAVGRSEVLREMQRRIVGFGGLGAGVRAFDSIVLRTELLAHTAFYRGSNFKPLDANAVQLVLGGTWIINKQTELDVGVTEDLKVNSAPDVTLLVTLRSKFRR